MVESTAKLRSEILALTGVDIMDGANQFKSTYAIMDELAAKWQDLTDIQQATVTELIAGKRQGNIVSSLMTNFDTARDALETSMNSAGSAMAEHEKWQQSLEAQINKLKASWQGLSQAFLKSDFLEKVLDAIINLVDGLTKLVDKVGAFPVLLGVFAGLKGVPALFTKLSTTAKNTGMSMRSLGDVLTLLQLSFPKVTALISKFAAALKRTFSSTTEFKKSIKGIWDAFKQHWIIAIVVAAITVLTAVFAGQQKKAEKLAQQVEELTDKYREQHEELQKLKGDYDTSNESSMISKYQKLSKGVDNLGRNVSLTAEEYSEYQDIVNQIADQIPSLVSGYDSQGNAILSVKGNVEELTEAYEKLIHAQNQEILSNSKNIEKDFENTIKDVNKGSFMGAGKKISKPSIELLEQVLDGNYSVDEIKSLLRGLSDGQADGVYEALYNADIGDMGRVWSKTEVAKTLAKQLEEDPSKIKGIIDNYYSQFTDIINEKKTIAQAKLSEAFDVSSAISGLDYSNITEELQTIARQIVANLDLDFFEELEENGRTVEQWTTELLNQLDKVGKVHGKDIESAFDLQTQFNGGEISYGKYVDGLESTGEAIDKLVSSGKLDKEIGTQIKLSIGLDEEGIVKEYDVLLKKLSENSDAYDFNITEEEAKKLLDSLSSEELAIAVDVITEMQENGVEETIEEVRNAIDRQLAINGLTLELDIEVEKTKLEALTTALTESFSGSGLSSESISAVEGMFSDLSSYDPAKLFERTANGIKLNSDELRKLNNESKKTNIAKINKEMDSLGDIYNQTREELYTLTYGTDEYNKKAAELKGIEDRIKATEKLAAQYEGLASAYQEWQMAESSGSERGMYEGLLEGWENVNDELSRGWVDDGTREFLELLKGETVTIIDGNGVKKEINIATASAKELKQVWKDLDKNIQHTTYSVHDFFTVDDEGNSTSKGVYNFLDAIGQMEEEKFNSKDVVKRDKNGNIIGFDFQIVGGDKAIAEALGISEELVQIMKRAAADAGFVVSFDGTYQQLDILREKAQKASETLNKVLKEKGQSDKVFSYNFNSNDEKDIIKQLENANKALNVFKKSGKIDLSMEGAEEALTVASTLQSMLDKLQRPAYMQIEVSEVEKNLQEPLRNLQELRTLTEQEHQLKLTGADTSELQKSKQEIYNYFETLDPEVKAELGLVDDKGNPLTGQALQDKLNSGEIAIEATVDIQMNMDEKLGVLVDKALYDAGIIDKKEFEKRVNVYLKADEVDDSDVDDKVEESFEEGNGKKPVVEKEVEIEIVEDVNDKNELDDLINNVNPDPIKKKVIVEYFAEHDEVDDYTPNQKKALVEFIANTDSLDEYTPEEKQAIVEYLTNSADPDSWTPEQKEAVAKFIRESSEVDSYTPDQKKAIAKFIKDSIEPDSYTPPSPTSTVTFNKDTTNVDTYDPPNFTRYVTYYAKKAFTTGAKAGEKALENRFGIVNGTANVNGTAFKQGSWGTKNSGTALVGELGREVLVRDGRYYTIGDNGAEFIKYQRGDIIFNHKQSDELFKYGKVTADGGRARAFANGTAFAQGTAFAEGNVSTETYDWIETLLSRLERTIDNFVDAANDTYTSWEKREDALYHKDEDGKETGALVDNQKLIDNLDEAIKAYQSAANDVDLDEDIKQLVREGSLDPNDVQNEADSKKIQEYETLWENYLKAQDKYTEAVRTQAELQTKYFDNIISKYEDILRGFEHTESMLDEYISQAEEKGYIVSKNYYQLLKDNKNVELAQLRAEQSALVTEKNRLEGEGVEVGSEKWYELCAEIDSVTQAIEEGNTALIEYDNAMRDIDWQVFDLIQERISDVTEEANFLIDLMSYDKLFDDKGKLTDKGMATIGLHGQNYNTYMYQADDYGAKVKEIDDKIASGEYDLYDTKVIAQRREYVEAQREAILNAEQEKEAIKDLVEDGINLELDALQELIDKKNEELESEKDLYEYQKKVKEQTEEIASLEKQMAAYSGDNSEEARAKVQELKVSLEEAKTNLEETEYDKYLSDTQQMLDTLYDEYELTLNARLDNLDYLVQGVIDAVNIAAGVDGTLTTALGADGAIATALGANATTIKTTLENEVRSVGTSLSTAMSNIWNADGSGNKVITMYGQGFQQQQTTTNTVLNGIKASVDRMVDDVDKDATVKVNSNKTTTSAKKNPTTTSSTKKTTTTKKTSSTGDGKPKIGDRVKYVSGQYYYDSQGKKPLGSHKKGEYVYITNINTRDWATHGYHISTGKKLGSGDLGWLKLNQLSGYATGKKNFLDSEIAWTQENGKEFIVRPSDGAILTPIAKGDSVLNAQASGNIWDMANSPAEFIKDNLNLGAANVPNNANVQNNITQNLDKIVFHLPNVKNYNELLTEMQKDPKFDKLIKAMTIDQIAGKSSLAKNKSIR